MRYFLYRCSECLSTIPLYYIARDNVLYCKRDYILKFGEHCQRCSKQITGPLMVSIEANVQTYFTICFENLAIIESSTYMSAHEFVFCCRVDLAFCQVTSRFNAAVELCFLR